MPLKHLFVLILNSLPGIGVGGASKGFDDQIEYLKGYTLS